MLFRSYQLENLETELTDYTRSFQKNQIKRELQQLKVKMEHVYKTEKGGDYLALQAQWQDLRQRLKDLESSC